MTERLPQNYIPTHYDLYLHVKNDEYPFEASVTITFRKNNDFEKFYLHIDQTIDIQKITQSNTSLDYTLDYPQLIINLAKTPEGDFSTNPITIEYKVTPNLKRMHGFFKCNDTYLTNFEPTGARQLFPCFDEPFIRSTFSIKLLIPTNLRALSNMPYETIIQHGEEHEIIFQETPPICTYLVCLCIGTFSKITAKTANGTNIEFYSTRGEVEKLNNYLNTAIYAVNWIESTFSVKYEMSHLQLVSVYGFGGGMENYGLITLSDCTDEYDSIYKELIVIHEVIHQWYGDIVSIKYWNSLWLNEGFAQFIEYLILNDYKANSNAFDMFANREARCCLKYFNSGILVPNENEVDFVHLFNSLVYSKGAFVLKMFYDLIGKNKFDLVCSNYLKSFKNKSVEVSDFLSVVKSSSNDDFNSFFEFWLNKSGFPVLIVNEIKNCDKNVGISIEQKCKNCVDFVQLKIPIIYGIKNEIKKDVLLINSSSCKFDLEFDWIIVNDQIGALCFVLYSIELIEILRKLNKDKKIDELNRLLIYKSITDGSTVVSVDSKMIEISKEFEVK